MPSPELRRRGQGHRGVHLAADPGTGEAPGVIRLSMAGRRLGRRRC